MTALKPKVVTREMVEGAIRDREIAWAAICKGIIRQADRYEREQLLQHYKAAYDRLNKVLDWREDFVRWGNE